MPLSELRSALLSAAGELSAREIKRGTNWALELALSIPSDPSTTSTTPPPSPCDPRVLLARSRVHCGEFSRAASLLIGVPGNLALFLRCYSLLLSYDRRCLEDSESRSLGAATSSRSADSDNNFPSAPKNGTAASLSCPGGPSYLGGRTEIGVVEEEIGENGVLEEDPHLCYVLALCLLRTGDRQRRQRAVGLLQESLRMFPYNHGALCELARSQGVQADRVVSQGCLSGAPEVIREAFLAQCALNRQANVAAKEILERLVEKVPESRFFRAQLALAHSNLREPEEAEEILQELHAEDPLDLGGLDLLSNCLYIKQDSHALSMLAGEAEEIDRWRPETCVVTGNYYSLKERHEEASLCFERATRLDPTNASAFILLGHEHLEMKNVAASIKAYRKAVEVCETEYRAWFGLGQAYNMLHQPLYALHYFSRTCKLRPYDSRMWCAVGQCYEQLEKVGSATKAYVRAFANDQTDCVTLRNLARLFEKVDPSRAVLFNKLILESNDDEDGGSGDLSGEGDSGTVAVCDAAQCLSDDRCSALLFLAQYSASQPDMADEAKNYCSKLLESGAPRFKDKARELLSRLLGARREESTLR